MRVENIYCCLIGKSRKAHVIESEIHNGSIQIIFDTSDFFFTFLRFFEARKHKEENNEVLWGVEREFRSNNSVPYDRE